jgi:hypothetical protein
MRRLALLSIITLAVACATTGGLTSIQFKSMVETHAAAGILPSDWPEYAPEGSAHGKAFLKLVAHAGRQGIKVYGTDMAETFADVLEPGETIYGYYMPASDAVENKLPAVPHIFLEKSLSPDSMFQTLAHELGHHYAATLAPRLTGEEDGQVFAEAVAFLVCQAIGLDTFKSSAGYIWEQEREHIWVLQFYAKEIDAAAAAIIKELK